VRAGTPLGRDQHPPGSELAISPVPRPQRGNHASGLSECGMQAWRPAPPSATATATRQPGSSTQLSLPCRGPARHRRASETTISVRASLTSAVTITDRISARVCPTGAELTTRSPAVGGAVRAVSPRFTDARIVRRKPSGHDDPLPSSAFRPRYRRSARGAPSARSPAALRSLDRELPHAMLLAKTCAPRRATLWPLTITPASRVFADHHMAARGPPRVHVAPVKL